MEKTFKRLQLFSIKLKRSFHVSCFLDIPFVIFLGTHTIFALSPLSLEINEQFISSFIYCSVKEHLFLAFTFYNLLIYFKVSDSDGRTVVVSPKQVEIMVSACSSRNDSPLVNIKEIPPFKIKHQNKRTPPPSAGLSAQPMPNSPGVLSKLSSQYMRKISSN